MGCLADLQVRWGAEIEGELTQRLSLPGHPTPFSGMLRYQLGQVDGEFRALSVYGGKRFRPVLCLLACEAAGGQASEALVLASAIELLHNFSLVHDDIEDRDESRRHRPTVWKMWGEAQGINVGDAMFAAASGAVLEASTVTETCLLLARNFQQTAFELTEGQYLDMSFETRNDVLPHEYLDMIAKKTGALIAYSLWGGALLGGAHGEELERFSRFGRELGLAFQIYDDIMGIWGESTTTGKQAAKDLHNGKKTLPMLLAVQSATPEHQHVLRAFLDGSTDGLPALLEALNGTDARGRAETALREHLTTALATLDTLTVSNTFRRCLRDLARELVS